MFISLIDVHVRVHAAFVEELLHRCYLSLALLIRDFVGASQVVSTLFNSSLSLQTVIESTSCERDC